MVLQCISRGLCFMTQVERTRTLLCTSNVGDVDQRLPWRLPWVIVISLPPSVVDNGRR